MFNKYTRDKHLNNIKELTKRKMVTGYLQDEKFNSAIELSRTLASPARRNAAAVSSAREMNENKSITPPPLNETEKLSLELEELEKTMLKNRQKRKEDLANRSKMRMQTWLGRLDYNVNKLDCKLEYVILISTACRS